MEEIEVEDVRVEGSWDWEEFAERTEGVDAEVDDEREDELRSEACSRDMLGTCGSAVFDGRDPSASSSSSVTPSASSVSSLLFPASFLYLSDSCTMCSRDGGSRFSKLAERHSKQ